MTASISEVMQKDLQKLKKEIENYTNEDDIWELTDEIPNSAGNLCLHICGNLLHFIGAVLGDTGYIRDREAEFADRNLPVTKLQSLIDTTIKVVSTTLKNLDSGSLSMNYPQKFADRNVTTGYLLVHLTSHLGYHLGQINYHRRLLNVGE